MQLGDRGAEYPALGSMTEPSAIRRRLTVPLCLALLVALVDVSTKAWAEAHLAGQPPRVLFDPLLRLELTVNPGAAFGLLGGGGRTLPVLLGAAMLGYLLWLTLRLRATGPMRHAALGLMLGGALANLWDRAVGDARPHGLWSPDSQAGVIDFIVLEPWPGWTWPAFNLADAALVVGAGLLLLTLWRLHRSAEL